MRRLSFFSRLLLGNLLLVGVVVVVAGLVSYRNLNARYQRIDAAHQRELTELARQYFERLWGEEGPPAPAVIDAHTKELFGESELRLTIIAPDGVVLGDSDVDPATMENHLTPNRPEISEALDGKHGRNIRRSETMGVELRYFAEPIRPAPPGSEAVGVVRVAMPVRAIAEGRGFLRNVLVVSALTAGIAALLLALLLSWMWYAPLRLLDLAARRLAKGDLSKRVHISGSPELIRLADALNGMRDSLSRQIETIRAQRENLQTVVSNLGEGVIATDADQRIVLMNSSAGELFGVDPSDAAGRKLQQAVRVPEVVDAMRELTEGEGDPISRRFEIDQGNRRRTLDLRAVEVPGHVAGGVEALLVVRDQTDLARTAAMKSEFVANASHELRTPLATIRAAIDSLEATDPTDREAFAKVVGILDRHATRLESMVTDLLALHMVETSRQRLQLEQLRLGLLAGWVREQFAATAEHADVALDVHVSSPAVVVDTDRTLVQLIVQNLVDNAIKFTPAGGRVETAFTHENQELLIRVSDTGCGIPSEFQDRVFERFFQVEESRSGRKTGRGTGLGLSIVKHSTERLEGELTLKSEVGKGTTVEVRIPARRVEHPDTVPAGTQ